MLGLKNVLAFCAAIMTLGDNKQAVEPVYLNIYDLNKKINRFASRIGLGLYHSGVQVHGKEYTFRRQACLLAHWMTSKKIFPIFFKQ